MITEDYVSFETAKLLREKGFDGECRDYYDTDGHFRSEDFKSDWNHGGLGTITIFSAPTLQMAMKWLREVHHIFIRVIQSHIEYCTCEIYYNSSSCYKFRTSFDSYEEACDSAIKYCLENFI